MSDHGKNKADAPPRERLQRVLAARGVASRRAAEEMIVAGRVTVNGRAVTELGTKVDPIGDVIRVDGRQLREARPRYVLLNKPSGFITTVKDERSRWTVMDLVDVPERVYPVGRLDRETQGLVLLTNDGEVANRVMHPRYRLAKEYHVFTDRRPTDNQLQRLRDGVDVDGRRIVPDECRLLRESGEGVAVKLVLHEGLYHVVRRMMEIVGVNVTRLRRFRIGPLRIVGIPSGAWRDLTPGELEQLFQALRLPAETAARANQRRTIQLEPVGGFDRGGQNAPSNRSHGGRPGTDKRGDGRRGAPDGRSAQRPKGPGERAGRPSPQRSRPSQSRTPNDRSKPARSGGPNRPDRPDRPAQPGGNRPPRRGGQSPARPPVGGRDRRSRRGR